MYKLENDIPVKKMAVQSGVIRARRENPKATKHKHYTNRIFITKYENR